MMVVLPGGGYEAEALARRGTAAAVLKYRLPNPETGTHPDLVPLTDLRQALFLLRGRHPPVAGHCGQLVEPTGSAIGRSNRPEFAC